MALMSASQITEKHNRRTKAASEDMRRGIEAVTEAPGKAAAAKAAKMKQNLVKSIDDGTWARRVAGVSVDSWKKDMLEKGVGRVAAGLDAAADKTTQFWSEFLPVVASVQSKVAGMPDLTLEDNIQRMTANARGLAAFKRK